MLSFHASVTAAKIPAAASLGSDGDSIGGFKWSRCGTPGGAALTPSPSRRGTGPVSNRDRGSQIGTGGSRIGTRRKVWCKGVIQIVAGRASRAGVVELWTPADEATRFQIPKCAQDCTSAGIGFGHQGANRGVAREVLVPLFARRMRMNFAAEEPTSASVAQASALQLILTPGTRIARRAQSRRSRPCAHSACTVPYQAR